MKPQFPNLSTQSFYSPEAIGSRYQEELARLENLSKREQYRLQKRWRTNLIGIAMALALGGSLLNPVPARAADITVEADGVCTLAEAIAQANDTGTGDLGNGCAVADHTGADTITLNTNVYLDSALPDITSDITIEGGGHTIERTGGPDFSVLTVSGGNLTLNEATISGGSATKGGGILNEYGTLTVQNSAITGNSAVYGGGIFNGFGEVNVEYSIIIDNLAASAGGGIYAVGYSNTASAHVTVKSSTITGNTVDDGNGGGIYADGYGSYSAYLIVERSTISGNSAYDANHYDSYYNGHGGGIFAHGYYSDSTHVIVDRSTISGNSADEIGGGIWNESQLGILGSTISDNSTGRYGGGIRNFGIMHIENSLVSGNTAGVDSNEIDNYGNIYADDNNFFGHSGETNGKAFYGFTPGASDINATSDGGGTPTALGSILDPTLKDNGGPTYTHALVSGSPALDVINSGSYCGTPSFDVDQRGETRPVSYGGGVMCDIGSFELQPPPVGGLGFSVADDVVPTSPTQGWLWGGLGAFLSALVGGGLWQRRRKR